MAKESHYSSKKDRVFVRGIQGQYSLKDELARLRGLPRVIKGKDLLFNDGPQSFSKHFIEPVDGLAQTLHVHLEEYGPGGRTQKHGHVNEAAFYILDGKGYEIHDGVRDRKLKERSCTWPGVNRKPGCAAARTRSSIRACSRTRCRRRRETRSAGRSSIRRTCPGRCRARACSSTC